MQELQGHPTPCQTNKNEEAESFIKELIPPDKFKTILNIGAGEGMESNFLKNYGYDVTAIVRGKINTDIATSRYPGIKFVDCDMHCLPFICESFDAIYMDQVLEHAYAPYIFLLECWCVLKIGGRLFTRHPSFIERTHVNDPNDLDARYISHHHPGLFPPNVYRQLFEKAGFRIIIDKGNDGVFLLEKCTESALHGDVVRALYKRDAV